MESKIQYIACFIFIYLLPPSETEPLRLFPLPMLARGGCCMSNPTKLMYDNQQKLKELIQMSANNLKSLMLQSEIDPMSTKNNIISPPMVIDDDSLKSVEAQKALSCAKIVCSSNEGAPLCACNYNNGNVVTFKNSCDMQKHNCRFETAFKMILNEICPWEFEFRRKDGRKYDYNSSKYYN